MDPSPATDIAARDNSLQAYRELPGLSDSDLDPDVPVRTIFVPIPFRLD
jgi:hypothetical protein